jgi:hypothetical protein
MTRIFFFLAAALCLLSASIVQAESYIWWEAENPSQHSFDGVKEENPAKVSAGGSLRVKLIDDAARPFAEYALDVPVASEYYFYPRHAGWNAYYRWRFDDQPWRLSTLNRKDFADGFSWTGQGKVKLAKGKHVLRIEAIDPELIVDPRRRKQYKALGFDCFILSQAPCKARRLMKPNESLTDAPDGWFAFDPPVDTFDATALLDLTFLNEDEAGSKGAIVRKGSRIYFEKTGEQVRFWGVCITIQSLMALPDHEMEYLAARMAKYGVNLVRLHGAPFGETEPGPKLERIHRLVSILKKKGIYFGLNWYCTACGGPPGQVYFHPPVYAKFKKEAECLLATKNPYTGLSLAADPSLAMIELLDEDSLFWHASKPSVWKKQGIVAPLEKAFGDWLAKKYGSLAKAGAAWGGAGAQPEGDDFAAGRAALYEPWPLGAVQGNAARLRDQAQFYTEHERKFYADLRSWIRDDLGSKALIYGSNWKTADERVLGPLDHYANMVGDMIARNSYLSGPCKGPRSSYALSNGDAYQDLSVLLNPNAAIMMQVQLVAHPFMMTEGGWAMPNRFRAEEQFMQAVYGSLQGMDGICPFRVQNGEWLSVQAKWPIETPVTMGQYPAAALIFRRGYVKEGPIVARDSLKLQDAFALKGASFGQMLGLDSFKESQGRGDETMDVLANFDPMAFYVGRVVREIGDAPTGLKVLPDLAKHIDSKTKVVRSATGEVALDAANGIATVDTPYAQGAAGFLSKKKVYEFSDATVTINNEYGAILIVSMDGKPLKTSGKVLVQVVTEEQNSGFKTIDTKEAILRGKKDLVPVKKVVEVGGMPLVVRNISGKITLRLQDGAIKVTALSPNGYPIKEVYAGPGRGIAFDLLPNCLYYVVQ